MNAIQNQVQLIGRPGIEIVLNETSNEKKYVRFNLATNERYKNAQGEYEDKAHWHPIVAWGKTAEQMSTHLNKGQKVLIKGKLQSRSYESKGEKKFVTEVLAQEFVVFS